MARAEADVAREPPGAETGDKPLLDGRQTELRIRRADTHVRGQGQLQAAAQGVAVNQAEDQLVHGLEDAKGPFPKIEIARLDEAVGQVLQIDAGGKGPAVGGDRDGAKGAVLGDALGDFEQFLNAALADGVQPLGPPQSQAGMGSVSAEFKGFVDFGHFGSGFRGGRRSSGPASTLR